MQTSENESTHSPSTDQHCTSALKLLVCQQVRSAIYALEEALSLNAAYSQAIQSTNYDQALHHALTQSIELCKSAHDHFSPEGVPLCSAQSYDDIHHPNIPAR